MLRAAGVRVFAIGLGESADADLLRGIAATPADAHPSPGTADLAVICEAIGVEIACG